MTKRKNIRPVRQSELIRRQKFPSDSIIKAIYVFIGVILGFLYLYPSLVLVINSFKPLRSIYVNVIALPTINDFTLANYPDAFRRLDFIRSFSNSVLITTSGTVFISLFASMAAWVLARAKTKTSRIIFNIFALSILIPFQCVMLPLLRLMGSIHMINRFGLVFMNVGFGSCMAIVLYHGFINNIPGELEEAAIIDGCNMIQRFFFVVMPLMRNIIITVMVLDVMFLWNDFLLPSLTINKVGWQTLPLKTFLFFGQFAKRWDLGTSGLVLCITPVIIFYFFCQKYIIKGVAAGSVKG